jgi:uncharacterized protein
MRRLRSLALPELFLGLLSLAVAVVLTAHTVAGTIHDAKHRGDTVTVTGSARKPISSDLVQWSLEVAAHGATPAAAARRLRAELVVVRAFLVHAGIPGDDVAPDVVQTETIVHRLPHHQTRTTYRVSQGLEVSTRKLDVVQATAPRVGSLIERGIDVAAGSPAWIVTDLARAKLETLAAATGDARQRAEILVKGLGGRLGRMRASSLGVYQVTPRFSTDVTDYGVNDTSSRDKDITAVVSATFDVKD